VSPELLHIIAKCFKQMPHKGLIVDPDRIKVEVEPQRKIESYIDLPKEKIDALKYYRDNKRPEPVPVK